MASVPVPTMIGFEQRYSDDSGVEFGVRLIDGAVQFEAVNKVDYPLEQLPWLLSCLTAIAASQE